MNTCIAEAGRNGIVLLASTKLAFMGSGLSLREPRNDS